MAEDRNGFVDYTQDSTVGGGSTDLSNYYNKAQTTQLVSDAVAVGNRHAELLLGYKTAYVTRYVEPTTVDGVITTITIWSSSSKAVKLYTKAFEYVDGTLVGVTTADELSGRYENKTFVYVDDEWKSTSTNYGG